jgi:hypothetical protein
MLLREVGLSAVGGRDQRLRLERGSHDDLDREVGVTNERWAEDLRPPRPAFLDRCAVPFLDSSRIVYRSASDPDVRCVTPNARE